MSPQRTRPDQFNPNEVPVLIEDHLWNGEKYVPTYIHISSLDLGPALGGCRIAHYEKLSRAMINAEQLSWGMRSKAALAGLPYGGGKAVLAIDPAEIAENEKQPTNPKRERLLRNFAAMVNELDGNYITAEDTGSKVKDMDFLAELTPHVVGTSAFSGNPSPVTAYGVYVGMRACLKQIGRDSFEGLRLAMKGAGSVAEYLVFGFPKKEEYDPFREQFPGLAHLGVEVIYYHEKDGNRSDTFKALARKQGVAKKVQRRSHGELLNEKIDVFVPAAARYSASLSIEQLIQAECKIIAGPENNQLEHPEDLVKIHQAGIVYAPDFAINAGGLINVHFGKVAKDTQTPYNIEKALAKTEQIERTIANILQQSAATEKTTLDVAQQIVEERIRGKKETKS